MKILAAVAASWFAFGLALGVVAFRPSAAEPQKCAPEPAPRLFPSRPMLVHPLGCEATMVVSVGGVITQRPSCYVPSAPRVWL